MKNLGRLNGNFGEAVLVDALLDTNKELCFLECIVGKAEKKELIELITCLASEERKPISPEKLLIGVHHGNDNPFAGCYTVVLKARMQYRVIEQNIGNGYWYLTFFRADISDKTSVVFTKTDAKNEISESLLEWVDSIDLPIPNSHISRVVAKHILDNNLCKVIPSFSQEKFGIFIKDIVFANDFALIREVVQKTYSELQGGEYATVS